MTALDAHTLDTAQQLFDRFAKVSNRFGLTVILKKTEVLLQPSDKQMYSAPVIRVTGAALKSVDRFCYIEEKQLDTKPVKIKRNRLY